MHISGAGLINWDKVVLIQGRAGQQTGHWGWEGTAGTNVQMTPALIPLQILLCKATFWISLDGEDRKLGRTKHLWTDVLNIMLIPRYRAWKIQQCCGGAHKHWPFFHVEQILEKNWKTQPQWVTNISAQGGYSHLRHVTTGISMTAMQQVESKENFLNGKDISTSRY